MTLTATLLLPCVMLAAEPAMSPAALARYQKANAAIQSQSYADAITALNALATEYPKVAEIFASRCSAQAGAHQYEGAEADCTYALQLKPQLAAAIYALAVAQEGLGKRDVAAATYRRYGAFDRAQAPYRDQALARAAQISPEGTSLPPPPPGASNAAPKLVVYRNHHFAGAGEMTIVLDNRLVGDIELGQYVEIDATPGDHVLEVRSHPRDVFEIPRVWTLPVQLGAGYVYANLDTSAGRIILQQVQATQARTELRDDCKLAYERRVGADTALAPPVAAAAPMMVAPFVAAAQPPECHMGADGRQACGYNCRMGADGIEACADTPNGTCAMGTNGHMTCSQVAGAGAVAGAPPPECRMSSRGQNRCGYHCEYGSNGEVYCASRPDGHCAMNSDGTWSCP